MTNPDGPKPSSIQNILKLPYFINLEKKGLTHNAIAEFRMLHRDNGIPTGNNDLQNSMDLLPFLSCWFMVDEDKYTAYGWLESDQVFWWHGELHFSAITYHGIIKLSNFKSAWELRLKKSKNARQSNQFLGPLEILNIGHNSSVTEIKKQINKKSLFLFKKGMNFETQNKVFPTTAFNRIAEIGEYNYFLVTPNISGGTGKWHPTAWSILYKIIHITDSCIMFRIAMAGEDITKEEEIKCMGSALPLTRWNEFNIGATRFK